jgi:hypothetical protein
MEEVVKVQSLLNMLKAFSIIPVVRTLPKYNFLAGKAKFSPLQLPLHFLSHLREDKNKIRQTSY